MNSHQTHQQLSIRSGDFGLHSIWVNWMFWGLEQSLLHETPKRLGAGMIPVDFHSCLCLSAQAPTRNLILKSHSLMIKVDKNKKVCNLSNIMNIWLKKNICYRFIYIYIIYTYVTYRSRNLRSRSPCWGTDEGRKNAPARGGLMLTGFTCWYVWIIYG